MFISRTSDNVICDIEKKKCFLLFFFSEYGRALQAMLDSSEILLS